MSDSESAVDEGDRIDFAQINIFQVTIHVDLRVRQDLLNTTGHSSSWQGLDQEHVDKVIPSSLYPLSRLVFGGMDVVNDGVK